MSFNRKYISKKRSAADLAQDLYTNEVVIQNAPAPSSQKPGDYIKTLLDPLNIQGVKIPDLSCYTTCTHREEVTFEWTPSTTTDKLYVGLTGQGWYTTAKEGGNVVTLNNIVSTDLRTRYNGTRLVSAGLLLEFVGDGDTNKGVIAATFCPFGQKAISGAAATAIGTSYGLDTHAKISQWIDSYVGPLKHGAFITAKPLDSGSAMFRPCRVLNDTGTHSTANLNGGGYYGNFGDNLLGWGHFAVSVKNLDTSTCQFQCKLVLNFESLLVDDTIDVPVTTSPINTAAYSAGMAIASALPSAGPSGSQIAKASVAKSVH